VFVIYGCELYKYIALDSGIEFADLVLG